MNTNTLNYNELCTLSQESLLTILQNHHSMYYLDLFNELSSEQLAHRVVLWNLLELEEFGEEEIEILCTSLVTLYSMFDANLIRRVYPTLSAREVKEAIMYALRSEIPWREVPKVQTYTFGRALAKAFRRVSHHVSSRVSETYHTAFRGVRNIGIRTHSKVKEAITSLLDLIKPSVSSTYHFILDFIQQKIDIMYSKLSSVYSSFLEKCHSVEGMAAIIVGFTIALLALTLPKGTLGWFSRFAIVTLGILVAYFKNLYSTAAGAAIAYVLATVRPSTQNINTNTITIARPQDYGIPSDVGTWISNTVCITSLLSMCVAGLEIPTDKKSLDEMLKRHALLGRAQQTWNVVGEKIVEYIANSTRLVYKYVLKKEYVSFTHVPEVDKLYDEVIELSKIDNASQILRDKESIAHVESMYLRYMHFKRVYASNRTLLQYIEAMGPPIIHFYKEISNHNPKGYMMRKEPVCVMFNGTPGVGKSFLMSVLQQDLLKIAGKYTTEDDLEGKIYSRAHEQEYWDGYVGQPIVIFDDFGQMKDSQANPNLEYFELLRTVNTFPYQLHSASLEQKGNNPFEADFICLTTNLQNIDPQSLISRDAIERRIHLTYTVRLIPEVATHSDPELARLDKRKLALYREENGLDIDDTSHWRFLLPNDYTYYSYEQVVTAISRVYQSKLNTYDVQKEISARSRDKPLPRDAFTVEPERWIPQGDDTGPSPCEGKDISGYVPLPLFLNSSRFVQQQILSHKAVYFTPSFILSDAILHTSFEDLETLIRYIAASTECVSYLSHPSAVQVPSSTCALMFKERNPQDRETRRREIEEKAQKMFEDAQRRESWKRWGWKLLHALSGYRHWYDETAPMRENFAFFLLFLVRTIAVLCIVFKFVDWVGSMFPNSYNKSVLLKYFKYSEVLSIAANLTDYPWTHPFQCSGYISAASMIAAVAHHYWQHPEYSKHCSECANHENVHKQLDVTELEKVKDRVLRPDDILHLESLGVPKVNEQQEVNAEDDPSHGKQASRMKTKYRYEDEVSSSSNSIKSMFPGLRVTPEGPSSNQAIELGRALRSNMYHLQVEYDGLRQPIGMVFCLKGHKALINYHYYQSMSVLWENCEDKASFVCKFTQHEQADGVYCSLSSLVQTAVPVTRGEIHTEFYMITLPKSCPLGKDIAKKHLITPSEIGKLARGTRVIMFTYDKDDGRFVRAIRDGSYTETFTAVMSDRRDEKILHYYPDSVKYQMQTQHGDCGAPIILASDSFQHKILGFHFGGIEGFGICSIITFSDVEKFLRHECSSQDPQLIIPQGEEISPFPLKDGSFRYLGKSKFGPVVQPCKTVYMRSLIHGFAGPSTVAPAVLSPALEEGGPMLKGLMKNAGPVKPLDPLLVADVVASYEEKLNTYEAMGDETRVLTFEEACQGIPGNKYFPPLKRSKSAGFPLMFQATKGKTDWLGNDEWTFDSELCTQLRKTVHEMENLCRQGIVPECYFVDTLKDEKRTLDKIAAKKTRVFSAAPMAFSILCRKYFMGFIGFMSRTRISNECAVGTCVYSEDWKAIVKQMGQFGKESIIAGDFSNFDGTIVFDLFHSIVDIVNRFYADSQQNQKVRRMIWECIAKSSHMLYDMAYQFSHGQPSGNPTTAVSNSIYNSLAIRYCYGLMGLPLSKFNDYVHIVAYGDDNLISVHPSIRTLFNPITLSEKFSSIGMTYTSEEKVEQSAKLRSITEVTFLKRSFSYDAKRDWWFAPLNINSIIESMNWIKKGPSPLQATLENCEDACDELYHHSRETFDGIYSLVQKELRQFGHRVAWKAWDIGRTQIALQQENFIASNRQYI